jgi:hypothetical protein
MSSIKLPKQWRHWCRTNRLKAHCGGFPPRTIHHWYYLRGHGRYWRVTRDGKFQCGDTYADFDRWALCDIREAGIPTSLTQFTGTVRELLAQHATKP